MTPQQRADIALNALVVLFVASLWYVALNANVNGEIAHILRTLP